ncbi:hypothetical protein [Halobacteriovorax sp. HLS]|uniref:hypothetical protein n=1 Tax=Halobacteriovorax sp. HLS TaxID=2234000 RepID=UPI000FDA3E0B|nr:hypothetical protein [Halobacteriovorax sp. HLS]
MKTLIFTLLLALTVPTLADNSVDFKAKMEESNQRRRDHAKKFHELKLQNLNDSYAKQLKFFDELEALAAQMKPGDKEGNKKIRKKMKELKKTFKEESKARRKAFKEEKLKPLKLQHKKEREERKKARKAMKKQKKESSN